MIRYEYFDSLIREEIVHPDKIFLKEQELARNFVQKSEMANNIFSCPFCKAHREELLFEKWGLKYAFCPSEWSVTLASLPEQEVIESYFRDSKLAQFRASKGYQDVVTKKRRDLWESLIGWIGGRVSRYIGNKKYNVADWGSKSVGWVETLQTANFVDNLCVIEPLPPIGYSEEKDEGVEIISLIDVIQRQTGPVELLSKIWKKLSPGGLLILTCRSGSGFDILTLRENSDSIFPLDHICLPSPGGIENVLGEVGFEILELTTPGMLDVKYVQTSPKGIPKEQYLQRYIFAQGDERLLERLQGFLQRNNLSSHLRCVARKK